MNQQIQHVSIINFAYAFVSGYAYIYVYSYLYIYILVDTYICIDTYIDIYMNIYLWTDTNTHMLKHTHVYSCDVIVMLKCRYMYP